MSDDRDARLVKRGVGLDPDVLANRDDVLRKLSDTFASALGVAIEVDYRAAQAAVARLDVNCRDLIATYYTNEAFAEPRSDSFTAGGPLDTFRFGAAVTRMLDLGLIRAIIDPRTKHSGYEWTFLGKGVIKELSRLRS